MVTPSLRPMAGVVVQGIVRWHLEAEDGLLRDTSLSPARTPSVLRIGSMAEHALLLSCPRSRLPCSHSPRHRSCSFARFSRIRRSWRQTGRVETLTRLLQNSVQWHFRAPLRTWSEHESQCGPLSSMPPRSPFRGFCNSLWPGTTACLSRVLPPRTRTITQIATSGLGWGILTGRKIRWRRAEGNRDLSAGLGDCVARSEGRALLVSPVCPRLRRALSGSSRNVERPTRPENRAGCQVRNCRRSELLASFRALQSSNLPNRNSGRRPVESASEQDAKALGPVHPSPTLYGSPEPVQPRSGSPAGTDVKGALLLP